MLKYYNHIQVEKFSDSKWREQSDILDEKEEDFISEII